MRYPASFYLGAGDYKKAQYAGDNVGEGPPDDLPAEAQLLVEEEVVLLAAGALGGRLHTRVAGGRALGAGVVSVVDQAIGTRL